MNVGSRVTLGLIAVVLLVIGVFSPVFKVFWIESDYWKDGEGDGVVIVILAVIALPLLFLRHHRWLLWIPTILIWLTLVYDFLDIVNEELIDLKYGWIFLFGGAALLAAAAIRPAPVTAAAEPLPPPDFDF
ncbi:MAG: hypothetical protein JXQ72_11745 [Anaerolineae bacterium]|nr:hypothetical protein [Anaerolineae bacterium]